MTTSKNQLDQLKSRVAAARDSDSGAYVLTTSAVIEALEAYISEQIGARDLVEFSDFFDVNESVELENADSLPDVLFEISSPEINGELTKARALELIERLKD